MQQLSLRRRYFALVLLGCCGLVIWVAGPVAARGPRVWLDPETLSLAPGDEGTLDVRVEDVVQMAGAEVHLTFDPALLEVVDADTSTEGVQVDHGGFLSPDFIIQNDADPLVGTVDYAIACMPVDKAVSGGGVLARITFRALDEGEAPLAISSVILADVQGQPITIETGSGVVAISRPGPSLVGVLIGLAAVAVAVGAIAVLRNPILAHYKRGGNG